LINTKNHWEALGEIQRAIHQILINAPTDLKESELDLLDEMEQNLKAMLSEEV